MQKIRLLSLALLILAMPAASLAQFGVSITIAPPELVAYSQPLCPQAGYLWTPGYWAYGDEGYFWVPGTWVEPPIVGVLWTPGYWGWGGNAYAWNEGYWGPTVGFYGGINYGYGYGGSGYQGGYWKNNEFSYNRSVNNVDVTNIHNTYEKTVINGQARNSIGFNGGRGGTTARPTAAQETAAHERHTPATSAQTGHQQAASKNHELLASVNHGKPPIAATSKPGELAGKGVVAANGAAAENKAAEGKATATRSNQNKAAEGKATATRSDQNKSAQKKEAATHSNENKAPIRSNETKTAHTQPAVHEQTAPRAQARAASAPHPEAATHAEPVHRSQAAPRPQSHPTNAPHEEKKAPGGKE